MEWVLTGAPDGFWCPYFNSPPRRIASIMSLAIATQTRVSIATICGSMDTHLLVHGPLWGPWSQNAPAWVLTGVGDIHLSDSGTKSVTG